MDFSAPKPGNVTRGEQPLLATKGDKVEGQTLQATRRVSKLLLMIPSTLTCPVFPLSPASSQPCPLSCCDPENSTDPCCLYSFPWRQNEEDSAPTFRRQLARRIVGMLQLPPYVTTVGAFHPTIQLPATWLVRDISTDHFPAKTLQPFPANMLQPVFYCAAEVKAADIDLVAGTLAEVALQITC